MVQVLIRQAAWGLMFLAKVRGVPQRCSLEEGEDRQEWVSWVTLKSLPGPERRRAVIERSKPRNSGIDLQH